MISLLSLAYLVASLAADISKISQSHERLSPFVSDITTAFDVPVLIFDLIFLVWIFCALCKRMGALKSGGQTQKLHRYRALVRAIGASVVVVMLFSLAIFASRLGAMRPEVLETSKGAVAGTVPKLRRVISKARELPLTVELPAAMNAAEGLNLSAKQQDSSSGTSDKD